MRSSPLLAFTARFKVAFIAAILSSASIRAQDDVRVWASSQDGALKLAQLEPLRLVAQDASVEAPPVPMIDVDDAKGYQTILGLGSSLERSTCFNLAKLSPEARERAIESLVDPEKGIGMSLMRVCIGTSDFAPRPYYTYDDLPSGQTDPDLTHFSIEKDREDVLPTIKLALAKNPALTIFASPWSPPAWMKEGGELGGGRLKPEFYPAYARYFVKFIQAYEAEGVPIHAITVQNEPQMTDPGYPTARWKAEEQRDFIKSALGPELRRAGLRTLVWCWDHNFNNLKFPRTIFADPEASAFVEGTGFHLYEGKPDAMTTIHDEFPEKSVYFTEGSVYGAGGAARIVAYLRNWARTYCAWVTVIDDKLQPNSGPHDCTPTIIVLKTADNTLDYRADYYIYGQFMKFIRPGATRIDSSGGGPLAHVAFKGADGGIVLVVVNTAAKEAKYKLLWRGRMADTAIAPRSVQTLLWKGE